MRQFRHYVGSASFTIITDHKPLLGLRGLSIDKDPIGKRARWMLELDPFNWIVQHRDGQQHANADALSRRPLVAEMGVGRALTHDRAIQIHAIDTDETQTNNQQSQSIALNSQLGEHAHSNESDCEGSARGFGNTPSFT